MGIDFNGVNTVKDVPPGDGRLVKPVAEEDPCEHRILMGKFVMYEVDMVILVQVVGNCVLCNEEIKVAFPKPEAWR